eukprot:c28804_g1_i3 orf=33-3395(+)
MDDLVCQCEQWLLHIELDLRNRSLTLNALQWALSALRALPFNAPACSQSGGPSQQRVPAAACSSDDDGCRTDSVRSSVSCIHVKRGDGHGRKGIAVLGKESSNMAMQFEERSHWERSNMSGGLSGSTEYDDELPELQVDIKIADKGEGGKHMAALIEERLAVPGCAALTNLIEHSLLVSLDQNFGEGDGDPYSKLGNTEQQENGDAWLHKWLVNSLLSSPKLPDIESKQPVSPNADLDWLVAYLAAANSSVFVGLLFEKLVPDVLDCKAGTPFKFLPLVRRAMILEFVSMRVGDHAAVAFLPFLPLTWLASLAEENSGKCFNFATCSSCYANIWLVLSFLSPGYLSACAHLMVPRLSVLSIKQWRTLLWSQNCGEAVLCALSRTFRDVKVEDPMDAQTWFCALFVKRLHHLSLVAADTILLLNQLCKPSVASIEKGLCEFGYSLLEAISQELCLCVHSHISGSRISDDESGVGSFMENLKCHVLRLWNEALCHISTLAQKNFKLQRSLTTVSFECCLALPESGSQVEYSTAEIMRYLTEYMYGNPFMQICLSCIVCCNQRVVADLLVKSTTLTSFASAEDNSFTRLFMVLNIMRLLTTEETRMIYEVWAQNLTREALMMNNKQALTRMLAVKELLNLSMAWSSHSVSASISKVGEAIHSDNLPSSPVWQCLKNALDNQWLQLLLFLNREDACELGLAVLGILKLLPPDSCVCPQKVIIRLKRSLGFLFWMLDMFYHHDNANVQVSEDHLPDGDNKRWQWVRLIEQVKCVIIQLATSSYACFTLMVNSLLDYSFQEVYWRFTPGPQKSKGLSSGGYFLGNSKTEACNTSIKDNHEVKQNVSRVHSSVSLKAVHLGNLLRRTLHRISMSPNHMSHQDVSPSYPISILSTLLADRLRTPHEMPMTAEQYEEVLPKNVSSSRHIFLIDCLRGNRFLFEMLQLIVENGCNEVFQCIEFIEALLADSIAFWHNSHRHRRLCTLETLRGNNDDTMDRMQVFQLIQMISTAAWLPESLAASSEIISLIDGADMADLLMIVWRCMHYALTVGPETWKSYGESVCCTEPPKLAQDGTFVGEKKSAVFTEWERQYFEILRRNVAQVGAHFAQVYPMSQKKRNSDHSNLKDT